MISIPTLKRLTIENEAKWTRDVLSCVTKIYAANLIHLHCISSLVVDFHLYDLSSLVDASIGLSFDSFAEDVTPQVLGLLSGVVNVKKLSIASNMLEGFDRDDMEGSTLGRVPSCFTSSLKTVRIAYFDRGFDEDAEEMWFVVTERERRKMDDVVLLPSSKHQKVSKDVTYGEGMDVISTLSDNVLHHILSFLSTEDSIRTSILSRRWQYLWTSISDINLDDISWSKDSDKIKDQCPMCHRFSDFVDRVLLLHDASDIRRLHLYILDPVNPGRLNSWISAATRHNVQELDLDLPVRACFLLPCCLFTCESLLVLKLSMDCVLKAPSFIHFSSLKTLVFNLLTFSDDDSMQHVFSSCPVLQELGLTNCGWKNIKTLTISVPTLKRLTIEDDSTDVLSCVVKIHAPNLMYLEFTSNLKVHFHLCGISSLVNASVDLPHRDVSQQHVSRAIGVLTGICNVKCLTLSADTLLVCLLLLIYNIASISDAENIMGRLPTFPNMTNLELNAEYCSDLTVGLINLLEKSPKLQFLDFDKGFDSDYSHDHGVCLMLERVPSCCCFKRFSLSCFEGKPAEMHFLRLLLKNATVLEKMTLYCEPILSEDSEKEEEVNNQLRGFPRRSESCVIELL
ncbi:hypothetical protein RHSIM_RhsimUnG0013100 [Rhododendron simsii]|uniref:FBD domain-containing protein n=1 Tax=Rhododendron simsii TaxID=118357 RepID=A0A834L5U5_RHOSS|nr:hypothetical protein RHSIM_RhsimUnG0013100 [Rhododendron simsii]